MPDTTDPLIPPHGGYRKLKTFQIAQLIYDITVRFCDLYIDKRSRTHDQMVQGARSGTQNIAEGSQVSGTSKKMEIKLTSVARASLEELKLDYKDYLRHRGLQEYPPEYPALVRFRALRCATLDDVRGWAEAERKRGTPRTTTDEHGHVGSVRAVPSVSVSGGQCASVPRADELVANAALSLLNLENHLLDRQINSQAAAFEREGGFTERLYQRRQGRRERSRLD